MNRKAQVTMEASLIFAVIVAALLATRLYFTRAVQGSWRSNTDSFSDEQYRPAYDPIFSEHDGNATGETVSGLKFINPKITVKTAPGEGQTEMGSLNTAAGIWSDGISDSGSGILRANDWGTYSR